jgi:hypothetical protein
MKTSEPKPTKEEILKSKFKNSFLDLDYLELYLEAMQEYAEQFHKEKLREELIKFAEWYDGNIIPKELIVEKYLKT